MEKLKTLNRSDLKEEYYYIFGTNCDGAPNDTIIAALYFGKLVQYVTQEELSHVQEC